MTVAYFLIAMHLQEVVLRKLEDDSEESEELAHNFIMDVTGESFNNGSIIVHNLWLGTFKGGNELGDIVDLGLVKNTRTYLLRWTLGKLYMK